MVSRLVHNLLNRYKCVYLRSKMTGSMHKCLSAALVLWYMFTAVGFDVHSCTVTGEKFVKSVMSGTACSDIHPEHSCESHGSCCGHDHMKNSGINESQCCTNDIMVLELAGSNVTGSDDDITVLVCHIAADIQNVYASPYVNNSFGILKMPADEDPLQDLLAVLSVWRI